MKTILHVVDHYPGLHSLIGGAEKAAQRIIRITEGEYRSLVVTQKSDQALPAGFFTVDSIRHRVPSRLRAFLTRVCYAGLYNDPLSCRDLRRILRRERPDIVHFHNCKLMGNRVFALPGRLDIPSALSIYDYWYFCPLTNLHTTAGQSCGQVQGIACRRCRLPAPIKSGLVSAAVGLSRRCISGRFLRCLDRFHVLSENSAAVLERQGIARERICVVRQSFEPKTDGSPAPGAPKRNVLLYAGWLAPYKGLLVVLEAFERFRHMPESADVVLVALVMPVDREYEAAVHAYLGAQEFGDSVRLLANVPREEFLRHLAEATAVVIAEQWENMSPVLLTEAMAYGKTIVAGAIGGIPEFLTHEETGLLATYNDPASYAEMFRRAVSDPQRAQAMGRQARRRFEQLFTVTALRPQYLAFYDALQKTRSGRASCAP